MTFLVALTLLFVVVIRVMTPEQRLQATRTIAESIVRFRAEARRPRPEYEPFLAALASRTPRAFVTPALAALNGIMFLCIAFSAGSTADALVSWGANFGPSTTNGEWWRLLTTMFVHASLLQLLISTVALIQVGLIVERIVGHAAFAAAYVGSGLIAATIGLSSRPVEVTVGASGAVAGICGLLGVVVVVGRLRKSEFTMPLIGIRRLIPAAAVFALYSLFSDAAELAGLLAGIGFGVLFAPGIAFATPSVRRMAAGLATAFVIAVAIAFPLRAGIADARPAIAHVVEVERSTATAYDDAVQRFRKGRLSIEALIKMIDQTIVPELHAAGARLNTLESVPPYQRPLVADAREFVRLRGESWRLRAEGLKKTNMRSLQQADRTERASFEALEKITSVGQN
jgi:membrane associated rhomboid family serine protease